MSEQTATKAKKKDGEAENLDPVHVVRKGAIAASIWQRQSPSGYAYYDFSLSRSWKSMSSEKMGYSRNFFETNQADLFEVIQRASAWITEKRASETEFVHLLKTEALPPNVFWAESKTMDGFLWKSEFSRKSQTLILPVDVVYKKTVPWG